jgi:hypothetical protein
MSRRRFEAAHPRDVQLLLRAHATKVARYGRQRCRNTW